MYVSKMLRDERIVELSSNGRVDGYLFYSICNSIEPYYKKKTWVYVPHIKNGHTLYVEKLVCKKWTKLLRQLFQSKILEKFPNLEQGIWHRYGKTCDRQINYRRKLCMK